MNRLTHYALSAGLFLFGLLLIVFWASSGGDKEERVVVHRGVSLSENAGPPKTEGRRWRTPLAGSWMELLRRARLEGWRGKTNGPLSGLRTHAGQKRLWKCWRAGRCPPAFHPRGPSRHLRKNVRRWGQWSQAVDVSRPRGLIRSASELGVSLWQPYAAEPWHIEALSVWTLPDITRTKTVAGSRSAPALFGGLLLVCLATLAAGAVFVREQKTKR